MEVIGRNNSRAAEAALAHSTPGYDNSRNYIGQRPPKGLQRIWGSVKVPVEGPCLNIYNSPLNHRPSLTRANPAVNHKYKV